LDGSILLELVATGVGIMQFIGKMLDINRYINNNPRAVIRAICAVTLSRFTGEKGAAISSQNIFWTTH
jgi:hypothetical protein